MVFGGNFFTTSLQKLHFHVTVSIKGKSPHFTCIPWEPQNLHKIWKKKYLQLKWLLYIQGRRKVWYSEGGAPNHSDSRSKVLRGHSNTISVLKAKNMGRGHMLPRPRPQLLWPYPYNNTFFVEKMLRSSNSIRMQELLFLDQHNKNYSSFWRLIF